VPADRVFAVLERVFPIAEVRAAVAGAPCPAADVDLSAHRTVLDLARDPSGATRLVTTNFDLLFEACDSGLQRRSPPNLPDPRRPRDFNGVIHLHGHVADTYDGAFDDEFVLSSADFGRAYLAEGWATQFIRALLGRYKLVFLGYAADDPPVQYLLEALNRADGPSGGLYAFQSGNSAEAKALWGHRGVEAIPYNGADGHLALWETLEAWAGRARDPEAWEARVTSRAQAGPEALTDVERGQVKHIVSTEPGARRFARASAPADWLYVFDPAIRYGAPWKNADTGLTVDPFDSYSLDDDSPPSPLDPDQPFAERRPPAGAWDGFALNDDDRAALASEHVSALRGYGSMGALPLPRRLHWLASWIAEVCDQPAAAWWAAGQRGLHSEIQKMISHHFERLATSPPTAAEEAWRYLFRAWNDSGEHDTRAFDLAAEIRRMGWSTGAVRAWSRLLSPHLSVRRPIPRMKPPSTDPHIPRNQIVDVEIEYPKTQVHFALPDEHLGLAATEIRRNLELGIDLATELAGFEGLPLPSIERDPQLGGDDFYRTYGIAALFFIYVGLLERLTTKDAAAARRETAVWRESSALFSRLRMWAAGRSDILGPVEAAELLLHLDDNAFWDAHGQRDLLLSLSRRWVELPDRLRRRLERRLLRGPPRREGRESGREYRERKAHSVLGRLIWLREQGCAFAFDLQANLANLRARAPRWRDEYGGSAARSLEGRGGRVERDLTTRGLEAEPPATLFARAAQLGGYNYDRMEERQPLAGLAAVKPVRFLRALAMAQKRGDPATQAWETFLNAEARQKDRPRLMWVIARRSARLPADVLAQIAAPVSDWILRLATPLQQEPREPFEALWSALLSALRDHPEATASGLISYGAIDWANHAVNSPIGKLAQALMKDESVKSSGGGFPTLWLCKAESLLSMAGDARRDALVIFSHQLVWIYGHAPGWAEAHLLSVLDHDREDERAFWSGFFSAGRFPGFELYARLKPFLLAMVPIECDRSSVERIAGMLLAGWGSFATTDGGERCVSNEEMREALRSGGDAFRRRVLWYLKTWSREDRSGWGAQALVLLRDVWPRERAVRTEETSEYLFDLAFDAEGERFTLVVDAVTPLMTTVRSDALGVIELTRAGDGELVHEPMALLKLLYVALAQSATEWPYHADTVVERLAANPATAKDPRIVELRRRLAAR
jgi:SIR2-like domain